MKKIFTFIVGFLALSSLNANAQTWDFTGGLSDATKANLAADATNWATNRTNADGVVTGWKNAKALSDGTVLTANGQTITEFEGILFNKCSAGNILLDPTSFRLGGKSESITFKGVQNGQTITIKAKSANSTATNRALVCSNSSGVTYDSTTGPADGICYGSGCDASTYPELSKAEGGVFTLIWTVETENEDGIDVTIGTGSASGGIDIQSIKVSGGKADEDKNVAWVSADPDNDMYKVVAPTTGIQYTAFPATAEISTDSLRTFDAVVISTDVTADSPMGKLLEDNIAFMPMINLNTTLFGYTAADVADTQLKAVNKSSDIFTDVNMDENGMFDYTNIGVALPERFATDDTLASCGPAVAIHQHNAKRNTYILLASDATFNAAQTAAWPVLLGNAITMAAATKKAVTKVSKPVISQSYAEGETTVSISCATTGSVINYAVDEGDWQVYSAPFTVSSECTVYAYTTAEGYNPMTEDEAVDVAVKVYTKTIVPTVTYTDADGVATVTMTADEGATIFYNFVNSSDSTESAKYTEPFTLAENTTVTAFAKKDGYLNSDAVSQAIGISGLKLMQKTLGHFNANATPWRVNQTSPNSSKAFYFCSLKDGSSKKYNLSENYTCEYSDSTAWTIRTSGQQVVWEGTSPLKKVGDTSNYNPVSITDLIGNEITGGEITFGATGSASDTLKTEAGTDSIVSISDKPSAELVSIVKFQAPFNVITYVGSKPGKVGFEYFVSTDGEKWDSIAVSPAGPEYTDAASKWRLWHRDVISYNGTDEVYLKVKSISTDTYRIFDVFVKGEGTDADGISEVSVEPKSTTITRKYLSNGRILIKTARGTFNVAGTQVK